MPETPTISIIVPVYNTAAYIERCARSLFRQTYRDIEFVFVNDATPDNSMALLRKTLEEYPARRDQTVIINHQVNRGLAAARQTGLDAASGEYIIMADSDDWVEPDMIEKMYAAAKREDADIVVADFFMSYAKKEVVVPQPLPGDGRSCIKSLFHADLHGSAWNKLARASLFHDHNIHYFEGLNFWEDLVTSVQLFFYAKKIVRVPEAFYHYTQTNSGSYTKTMSEASLRNMISAITFFEDFFRARHCYDEFEEALLYEKVSVKINLLLNSRGALQRERARLYPEADRLILKHPHIVLGWRVALWFAARGMLPVFNLLAFAGKWLRNKSCSETSVSEQLPLKTAKSGAFCGTCEATNRVAEQVHRTAKSKKAKK